MPTFNEEMRLDPAEVYLVIISAMDQLSMQPWSGPVDLSSSSLILSPGQRVALTTFGESQQLQPGHIILALYHIVLRMYNQRPGFYKLGCVVSLQEQKITTIYIFQGRGSLSHHCTLAKPEGTERAVSLVGSIDSLTENSGVVVDPKDALFRIAWTVDGRSIPIQEIFSAAVDGIVTAAPHGYTNLCSHATGVSFSGNVAFHIGQYSDHNLHCGQTSRAFGLLVQKVVKDQRIFQEMDFTLEYDGVKIGEGYILKMSSVEGHSNSTEGIATSRRCRI